MPSDSIKADILSLTTFEIGLFGSMIASYFILGDSIAANNIVLWFMMQVSMVFGLITTLPMYYLLKNGELSLFAKNTKT